ncbi:hypothetical protein N9140_01150 [bacterium]|nr:hypothetical protein [bacterium]
MSSSSSQHHHLSRAQAHQPRRGGDHKTVSPSWSSLSTAAQQ